MATNKVLQASDKQWIFADHATDFVDGASKTSLVQAGSIDVQMDMTSVANAAGRESAQVDLGASWANEMHVLAVMEFAATPVSGQRVDFYWMPSPDATVGDGNILQTDGADAASPSGIGTDSEQQRASIFIGSAIVTNDATATVQGSIYAGSFVPPTRYGSLFVLNEADAAFHSDAVETHFSMSNKYPDIAEAA